MCFGVRRWVVNSAFVWAALNTLIPIGHAQAPQDPGLRPSTDLSRISDLSCTDVTKPIPGLTENETKLFCAGADEFAKVDTVRDDGLGPTMNLTSCRGCHGYPSSGGSSPPDMNPQFKFAKAYPPGTNVTPFFVKSDGPIRVARLKKKPDGTPDGGVHSLFTIMGLDGADGCRLKQQDNFEKDTDELRKNLTLRIPTPTFGAGLIEQIDDSTIDENVKYQAGRVFGGRVRVAAGRLNVVQPFHANGVHANGGLENRNGNDGTIARFGWKAQNKSLLVFAGEAYNVEMGISNEVFPTERNETKECQFHTVPNDTSHPENVFDPDPKKRLDAFSDVEKFAAFMRFLAPPDRSTNAPGGAQSIRDGERIFDDIGCSACHTPTLMTSPIGAVAALRNKLVHLYSDLALHRMGKALDDGISQGQALGDQFRSAPLWGLGQRKFLMHNGNATDLMQAIDLHFSEGSDANDVIGLYRALDNKQKQDLLNFLRSL
jgi:CxxC motif-containing protein (DUF1111 family)